MDIVDQAQDVEAMFLACALAEIHGAAPALLANGQCYNCQDTVPYDLRFCDSFCRDDYMLRKAAETRRGVVRYG